MYKAELSTSQLHPQNHIHEIKSRYGFSMKTQYICPLLQTCMFLYLIINILSTKQKPSN